MCGRDHMFTQRSNLPKRKDRETAAARKQQEPTEEGLAHIRQRRDRGQRTRGMFKKLRKGTLVVQT